jgi:2-oxo-4-hydroxy-4-carboxy-5-ureidoimidazoline decarboxylase
MLDTGDCQTFVTRFGHLFEHSPWVVERAWSKRPFADISALHRGFMDVVREAAVAEKLTLFRAHPELGAKQALTPDSESEQAGAGLQALNADEFKKFQDMNAVYREKFGFPFVICVRLHTKASILSAFERRLNNDNASESAQTFTELAAITWLRLQDMTARENVTP